MAGVVGLFATRPLADAERAAVRGAAGRLDFTGVSLRDVRDQDRLVVARVHHAHTSPSPLAISPRGLAVLFDGSPRMPDAGGPRAVDAWLACLDREGPAAFLRLDGSFAAVVHDPRAARVTLVADRFNSRPLYYRSGAGLLAFASQASLLLRLPGARSRLDPTAVTQFLTFQTVLDERTFLADVSALPPAGHLEFPDGPRPPRRYWWWRPGVDDGRSGEEHGERLVGPLLGATRRLVGDGQGLALLLSGGLDARAVVACAPRPLPAVTLADFENTEIGLARAIAGKRRFPFTFVQRRPEHHVELLDLSVALGDGAHRYDNAQFAYLRAVLPPGITALATGYGFDRYFKGNSLPRQPRRLRGWALHRYELLPLAPALSLPDLARTILAKHAHFLWGQAPLAAILREPYRSRLETTLLETLEGILRLHWDHCPDAITRFEAPTFNMFMGRNHAFLNVLSIRHFFDDRLLMVDNALLDAAIAAPPRLRVNGVPYRTAMRRIAPDLWRIRDGNTGMPPDTSPLVLHARDRVRELRRRVSGSDGARPLPDPAFTERSWPNMAELLRHRPALAERLAKTIADPDALPPELFDSAATTRLLDAHLAGRANHVWLLLLLLTFGTWHRRHLVERPGEAEERRTLGPAPLDVMR